MFLNRIRNSQVRYLNPTCVYGICGMRNANGEWPGQRENAPPAARLRADSALTAQPLSGVTVRTRGPADCALRCVTPRSSVPVSVRRFGNQPLVTARTTFARTNQMNNYIVPSPSHPASCASVVCDGGARRQHATPLNRRFKTWRRLAPPPHVRSLVHRNSHTTTLGLISLHPCCWPRSATPDT